jgi:amino acid adenylation domain-containing protein
MNVEDIYPLSPLQQGFLFHALEAPKSGANVEQLACTLEGALDVDAFRRAWDEVCVRHPTLRTTFAWEDLDAPLQLVHRAVEVPLALHDWSGHDRAEQAARFAAQIAQDRTSGFPLTRPPLMRLTLARTGPREHRFLWSYHHLLLDGWSLPLVLGDFFALYEAARVGHDVQLPPRRPFRDYIAWLQQQDLGRSRPYWRELLHGISAPTALDLPRPVVQDDPRAAWDHEFTLGEETTRGLEVLARTHRLTLNIVLQGAWAVLLSRYGGGRDVVFGATVSGRPAELPGVEEMSGMFINTLPVRANVDPAAPFLPWLGSLQAQLLASRQHEHTPLMEIQGCSEVPRGTPLFETLVAFENYPVDRSVRRTGSLAVRDVQFLEKYQRGLGLVAAPGPALTLRLQYDPERFAGSAMGRLGAHLRHLLEAVVANPGCSIATLGVVSAVEREELLRAGRGRWTEERGQSVPERVSAQAARTPDALAVEDEREAVTYRELEERSNRLSRYLRRRGLGAESLVGLCQDRTVGMVVSVLGVLKAGCAYVPLDPSYPESRLAFMLKDSGAALLLTEKHAVRALPEDHGVPAVCLDEDGESERIGDEDGSRPDVRIDPDGVAYVIYTSGSTGVPKGVAVTHRALDNFLASTAEELGSAPGDRLLALATLSFDIAGLELLLPLTTGGAVVVATRAAAADGLRVAALVEERGITRMQGTPATWRMLLDSGWQGKAGLSMLSGGETLPRDLADALLGCGSELWNLYGPTETTIYSTIGRVEKGSGPVSIGRPIACTDLYLLDDRGEPVPNGVVGALYIGGDGLARGYLGRPALTAEAFVPDPLGGRPGARLYRTGDLGRYLPDGGLELVGRADGQVKLRGFRIELGEVEEALRACPGVKGAAAAVRELGPGDRRLIGYVVAAGEAPSWPALRAALETRLPGYMVPSSFVLLDALPLTPNGKLDRRALPGVEGDRPDERPYAAPRTDLERTLAEIWGEALGLERVGIHDDFFELGGHSLLATRLVGRIRSAFGVELPLAALLTHPTIAGVAAETARLRGREDGPRALPGVLPDPDHRHDPFPLTDVQYAYWIGRSGALALGEVSTYGYLEVDSEGLDLKRFEAAFRALVARHGALRLVIDDGGRQRIVPDPPPYVIEVLDLRGLPAGEADERLADVRRRMSHQVLDTARGPLFDVRASLLDGGRTRLHVGLDAMVADAWSARLMVHELGRLYERPEDPLPVLELSFRDYVLAASGLRQTEHYARSQQYWWRRLSELPPAPELPLSRDPATLQRPRFARRSAKLPAASWKALKARGARMGLSPSGLLLAVYAEVLAAWSAHPRFTINLTLFNRLPLHPQVDGIVGDFTSLELLEVDATGAGTFEDRARRLQARLWEDLDHNYVSGVEVLRERARRQGGGPGAAMPVVFTSTLGQELGDASDTRLSGRVVFALTQTPQVWLDHQVGELGGTLAYSWDAIEEVFPPRLLDDMFGAYSGLLARLAVEEEAWSAPSLALTPAAHLSRRGTANATSAPVPAGLLHGAVAAQAALTPGRPAVFDGERMFTHGELHERAIALGRRLRDAGARPNTLVAVVMERGWEQVVAVLGILHSGAAYLPIPAELPQERRFHLMRHGEVALAVTQPWLVERLAWPPGVVALPVADGLEGAKGEPAGAETALDPLPRPDDLAYVIYTSGSTGQPKGVMIDHRGALNTVLDVNQRFGVGPDDRVLALSSLGFDLSVYDVFGLLAAGGAVVLPDEQAAKDPARWGELATRHGVTIWNSVPALMELFVDHVSRRPEHAPRALRLAMLSGDWIPLGLPDQVRRLRDEGVQVVSLGGATEASIWSILFPVDEIAPDWRSIPYGRPMRNQRFHVLDRQLEPCPEWVPGDLFIGGVGLAQGYWRDEARTSASFLVHPTTGERLYRTGDRGRWLPDGTIEFLGREDFQVKVQGHRIELGEIEATMALHPGIRSSVVTAVGDPRGNKRLVGYFVAEDGVAVEVAALRTFLRERLPDHMVPPVLMALEALPLSSNGKVDRRALPEPEGGGGDGYQAPRTPTERALAETWSSLLRVPRVGVHDDFFGLGGDSVLAIQLLSRVRDTFRVELPLRRLFEGLTVERLGQAVDSATAQAAARPAIARLSRAAHRMEPAVLDQAAHE